MQENQNMGKPHFIKYWYKWDRWVEKCFNWFSHDIINAILTEKKKGYTPLKFWIQNGFLIHEITQKKLFLILDILPTLPAVGLAFF
jgi:hypothetical protein